MKAAILYADGVVVASPESVACLHMHKAWTDSASLDETGPRRNWLRSNSTFTTTSSASTITGEAMKRRPPSQSRNCSTVCEQRAPTTFGSTGSPLTTCLCLPFRN